MSGGLHTGASGIARILCDLAGALARAGDRVGVFTTSCAGRAPAAGLLDPAVALRAEPGLWLGRLAASPRLRRALEEEARVCDVVHNHSLWMLPNHYASAAARRHGKPAVFTAYGYLEPWALARSRWKKRIAGAWFQDADLRAAACLHVNAPGEIAALRAYGLRGPVAVVPNGVTPGAFDPRPGDPALADLVPAVRGRRVALFLGRLHPKKGLAHLVRAWSRCARDHGDWLLVIAGPDDGDEARIRALAGALGPPGSVAFAGALHGDARRAAYAGAECFVLPSFSEGFSQAVLEAMASRLPVLLTPGCHFPEAAAAGAAVVVEPTEEAAERGLRGLLGRTEAERRAMGARGRALVERRYAWSVVAESMRALYAWTAGGGAAPGFVEEGT